MRVIFYIIGMLMTMLSISRVFIHHQYIYIITIIIGLALAVCGRIGLDKKIRNFLYKKLLKDFPLIYTPWAYDGRFHITPNNAHTIGIGIWIGKEYLRQGIQIFIPYFSFTFYIHTKHQAEKIFDKNNPF